MNAKLDGHGYQYRLVHAILDVQRGFPYEPIGSLVDRILTARHLPALLRPDGKREGKRGRIVDTKTGQMREALPGEIGNRVKVLGSDSPTQLLILSNAIQRSRTCWGGKRK